MAKKRSSGAFKAEQDVLDEGEYLYRVLAVGLSLVTGFALGVLFSRFTGNRSAKP